MEFNLTDQMEFFEIQDYCILHGNSLEDLTIQSFFNFGVQKFTRLRLVTTMCDTLACFLGLNNLTPLADYHLMKGNITRILYIKKNFLKKILIEKYCVYTAVMCFDLRFRKKEIIIFWNPFLPLMNYIHTEFSNFCAKIDVCRYTHFTCQKDHKSSIPFPPKFSVIFFRML